MRGHIIHYIMISFLFIHITNILGEFSLKPVASFFGKNPYEEVLQQEYQLEELKTIVIENIDGPITIKTGLGKTSVFVKATKRANKEEFLPEISIKATQSKDKKLIIQTVYAHENIKGEIAYELIVPADIRLQVKTVNGNINVNGVNGPIAATTIKGNIAITDTQNIIHAQVAKKGTISLHNTHGAVSAKTHHGNIIVENAFDSIVASTTKGHITIACNNLPSTSSIRLETTSGPINLALPASVNASIKGQTEHGILSSEYYITLKPHATKLNTVAWNRYKREVDGILGTGEAEISLRSTYGNVKILERTMITT